MNAEKMAELAVDAIKKYVADAMAKVDAKIAEIERREFTVTSEIKVDADDLRGLVEQAVSEIEIAAPEPAPVDYDAIKEMIKESVSAIDMPHARDGVDGKDGVDGRDAAHIEILPAIEEEKSYPRGTFATHRGGLWRAYEKTHGMRGWECIVNGEAETSVEYDGARRANIVVTRSNGEVVEKEVRIPAMISKGVWKQGETYERGDYVQLSGSMWRCLKDDVTSRPNDGGDDWEVAVKRGGTGDSAYQIARKNGFDGSPVEWLDSLGKKAKVKV